MVVQELKHMYPDLKILSSKEQVDYEQFAWYRTNDGVIFGIPKEELSANEERLLDALLTRYEIQRPFLSDRERDWHDFIHYGQLPPFDHILRYRFIFFQIKKIWSIIFSMKQFLRYFPNQCLYYGCRIMKESSLKK